MEFPPRRIWLYAHYYPKLDPSEDDGKRRTKTKAIRASRHHNVLV
jgi:hypothetical protein